jgi:transposase-like protein
MSRKNGNGYKAEMNLIKLMDRFGDDDACREYLEHLRWPKGPTCPRCKSDSISTIAERNQYDCNSCRYQFSVTAGTIFHDSHLPLRKWFIAAYLMIESKKGMSAKQIQRTINVSYKTAWYLCHRIRAAMKDAYPTPLRGIIEVDETWVGGKVRGKGHGYKGNKSVVVGAVQRKGKIILKVVPGQDRKTLHDFIKKHTAPDTPAIYTDELPSYIGIADHDTRHETVNHSARQYVRGDVHTNTVESVWSLLKRSIMGAYHKLSVKHLDAYLDELEWRFNNRENPYLLRDTFRQLLSAETVEYKKLVA